MNDLNQHLAKLRKKYLDLEKNLQNPNLISNNAKYVKAAREYEELKLQIHDFNSLNKIIVNLEQTEKVLAEGTDRELSELAKEEIAKLNKEKTVLEKKIKISLIPKDPLDTKDIIVEIRAGAGGDEAGLFATELFRMYSRYAEKNKWQIAMMSSNVSGIGGFKEVIFEIKGYNVYSQLKYESGVHRVQRVPETEKSGRVHTSTATVAILPVAENIDIEIKSEDLRIDVFRSGGHGGQSVNTTDSAVRIVYLPTNLVVTCQDEKSQQKNKAKAMKVLQTRLLQQKRETDQKKLGDARRSQIGTGDRSEKIRTYNFPQDRITDHRLKQSWHEIQKILDGNIDPMIIALKNEDYKLLLEKML